MYGVGAVRAPVSSWLALAVVLAGTITLRAPVALLGVGLAATSIYRLQHPAGPWTPTRRFSQLAVVAGAASIVASATWWI